MSFHSAVHFSLQYNLDEFEFSQTYLFYWDKIERCHYFLNNIIETAVKGEETTGRVVSFLLDDPTCDGELTRVESFNILKIRFIVGKTNIDFRQV